MLEEGKHTTKPPRQRGLTVDPPPRDSPIETAVWLPRLSSTLLAYLSGITDGHAASIKPSRLWREQTKLGSFGLPARWATSSPDRVRMGLGVLKEKLVPGVKERLKTHTPSQLTILSPIDLMFPNVWALFGGSTSLDC